jgi:hypothetical protein
MRELNQIEEKILGNICAIFGGSGSKTEDNYSSVGTLVCDTKESSEDVSAAVKELLALNLIKFDHEWFKHTGMTHYSPTDEGVAMFDDWMYDDEPSYNCICRGAGACIQCNPNMFL